MTGLTVEQCAAVGNVAAALGVGAEGCAQITAILDRMSGESVVHIDALSQLCDLGVPALSMLAYALEIDIGAAIRQVDAGTVSTAAFGRAFYAEAARCYGGESG